MTETVVALMDAAENAMRLRGYHAVSFRDLADELGIKSSSVHYYFRQKEDLGLALVKRYQERFFKILELKVKNTDKIEKRLQAFFDVYRESLVNSDRICLCGMLGAESSGLPDALSDAVSSFFQSNINWIAATLDQKNPKEERKKKAQHILTTLQGAMMIALSLDDYSIFDNAVQCLIE